MIMPPAGCGALNCFSNARIRHATAKIAVHRLVDFLIAGIRRACEQAGCLHDLPRLAIAALRHLFLDPGGLQGLAFR
jgi:hypothetical protein